MDNVQFYHSFALRRIALSSFHHTDNETNGGVTTHFLGWLQQGTARLEDGLHSVTLAPGQLVYIPSGCRYHSYWTPDEDGKLCWYSISCDYLPLPEGLHYPLQGLTPDGQEETLLRQLVDDREQDCSPLCTASNRLYCTAMGRLYQMDCNAIATLYRLYSLLLERMTRDATPQPPEVQRVLAVMRAKPESNIAQIATECDMSESALYALFKRSNMDTPNEVRLRLLCQRAADMLQNTDAPIEKISNDLSFSSSSYFRKTFRNITGMSPRECRSRVKNRL